MSEEKKELTEKEIENVNGGQITAIPRWKCSNCGTVNNGCISQCKKCGAKK